MRRQCDLIALSNGVNGAVLFAANGKSFEGGKEIRRSVVWSAVSIIGFLVMFWFNFSVEVGIMWLRMYVGLYYFALTNLNGK